MRTDRQVEINIPDIISLTARLAQILAQEADLLQEMRIKDVAPLQKEKTMLANALEIYKKLIDKDPGMLRAATEEEREDLVTVTQIFDAVLQENYRRLLTAREVNLKVVEAITEAVGESNKNPVYDETGAKDLNGTFSVTLNKTI